jgi:putative transposase
MSASEVFHVLGVPDMRVEPFWNTSKRDLHRRLWLPRAAGLTTLDLNLKGTKSLMRQEVTAHHNWSVDAETPHDAEHRLMVQKTTQVALKNAAKRALGQAAVGRSTSLSHPVTALKIRMYPNQHQKGILAKWFGAARFVYDRCLDEFSWTRDLSMTHLRDEMLRNLANDESHQFLLEVPDKVKAGAVADFIGAVRSNLAKLRKRPGHHFKMKYRTKKDNIQSLLIPKDAISPTLTIFKRTLGSSFDWRETSCKRDGELCFPVGSDCRLTLDRCGRYFLHVVAGSDDRALREACKKGTVTGDNQACGTVRAKKGVVGLDPGIKTFQTFYSPDGVCGKIGRGLAQRLFKLRTDLTDLNTRIKAETHNTRRVRMKKAVARMRARIKNIVDELHWKTARFLCSNFKIILIPEFRVQRMVQGNLHAATKQAMHDLRHFTFRTRLMHKARQFPDTTVVVCSEAYTTQTCSRCGKLNRVGCSDVYRCSGRDGCGMLEDRDTVLATWFFGTVTYIIGSPPFHPLGDCITNHTAMFVQPLTSMDHSLRLW